MPRPTVYRNTAPPKAEVPAAEPPAVDVETQAEPKPKRRRKKDE